ncbi:helix-turn-helix domain containing protein [Cognatishimia sp. SS12]|uniref:TetR/AcrR family transcriptional regulator n=1 Tax=Cognatishimia sp. SS12 TaxID=2979465 RepID=UPI00232D9817|nr:TetR/AcrR family transcriptional regulator [Cognatishimia sp. SS12]MDC0738570.1 helix-turn-helix domain containing protein [Cognatishimia sp. SS12]
MRTRLSKSKRREDILRKARQLFLEQGLADTEMEDIRLACGVSRGGLYHHFSNKRAVLDAVVEGDVAGLADALNVDGASPILVLLEVGSSHRGANAGVLSALQTPEEKLDYLSSLEQAFSSILMDALVARMGEFVRNDINAEHVAELFMTINTHINRREILGQWSSAQAAGFAATSLEALAPLLQSPEELAPIIADLKHKASS